MLSFQYIQKLQNSATESDPKPLDGQAVSAFTNENDRLTLAKRWLAGLVPISRLAAADGGPAANAQGRRSAVHLDSCREILFTRAGGSLRDGLLSPTMGEREPARHDLFP